MLSQQIRTNGSRLDLFDLSSTWDPATSEIGSIFIEHFPALLQVYTEYSNNYDRSMIALEKVSTQPWFVTFCEVKVRSFRENWNLHPAGATREFVDLSYSENASIQVAFRRLVEKYSRRACRFYQIRKCSYSGGRMSLFGVLRNLDESCRFR